LVNAQRTSDDLRDMRELVLSGNRAPQMPNVENTLRVYFSRLVSLDVSANCIRSIEAVGLCRACPLLEKLNFSDNLVEDMEEVMPLGRLKVLSQLVFLRNPVTETQAKVEEARGVIEEARR